MMRRDEWADRLSEYIDGDMGERDMEALEVHLLECGECAVTLEELRAVVAEAGALPAVPPERDLWPEIEARLAPRGGARATPDADVIPLRRRRRVTFTVPQLAAAGLALALASASGTWAALRRATALPAGAAAVNAPPPQPESGVATPVSFVTTYDAAVTELEHEFERRRADLDPETIIVVERNLDIIDGAIAEARRALAADPSSAFLNEHLAETMRRKMDLLRQATSI